MLIGGSLGKTVFFAEKIKGILWCEINHQKHKNIATAYSINYLKNGLFIFFYQLLNSESMFLLADSYKKKITNVKLYKFSAF